jgi:hypothetical protein
LERTCNQGKTRKPLPPNGAEFQKVNNAATDVAAEEKVISFSIRHSDRIEAWELPQVTLGVFKVK